MNVKVNVGDNVVIFCKERDRERAICGVEEVKKKKEW